MHRPADLELDAEEIMALEVACKILDEKGSMDVLPRPHLVIIRADALRSLLHEIVIHRDARADRERDEPNF